MQTLTPRTSLVRTALVALTLLFAAGTSPAPAAAADCAGSYVRCLDAAGAIGSSDTLHEESCYAAYWACLWKQALVA